jgi:hypothetical protein
MDWPDTVSRLLALAGDGDVLVPGHGAPVGTEFARAQQQLLATVAGLIRELHGDGVPASKAAEAGGERWPVPLEGLAPAIETGYAQLSPG